MREQEKNDDTVFCLDVMALVFLDRRKGSFSRFSRVETFSCLPSTKLDLPLGFIYNRRALLEPYF